MTFQLSKLSDIGWALAIITFLACVANKGTSSTGCNLPVAEYNALEDIYDATNGSSWCIAGIFSKKWTFPSSLSSPCQNHWIGLTCTCDTSTSTYHITGIALNQLCLTGTIPPSIGNLSYIQSLAFIDNSLAGTIPSTMISLSHIKSIQVGINQLTGPFPEVLTDLNALVTIELNFNSFAGTIPSSISRLSNVSILYLNSNNFTGAIPIEIGSMTSLQNLFLYYNQLTGTIPVQLSLVSRLQLLILNFNRLTGTIPNSICQLTNLIKLSAVANILSGTIPFAIANLRNLKSFYLNENQLTGTIPSTLTNLTNISELYLSDNMLIGSIPNDIGRMTNLLEFQLYSNFMTSTIPNSIGSITGLFTISIYDNYFSGSIPSELYQLNSLNDVFLYSNMLTGTISNAIASLTALLFLDLNENFLTGSIPSTITTLTQLQHLYLITNFLSGSIPANIGHCTNLVSMLVYGNQLSSSIPDSIAHLTKLEYLFLNDNQLISSIPAGISNLTSLFTLFINDNQFTGTFPSFASIADIRQVSISNNRFHGSIFSRFPSNQLYFLNIANNLFTGTISPDFFTSRSLLGVIASGNCLTGSIPDAICNAETTLTSLDFSNSGGNKLCQQNQELQSYRPSFVQGTFSKLGLSGTIPSCLIASPYIVALLLAGNKLHGTLPGIIKTSELTNLTTSHNALTGNIPTSIQTHNFIELDLSNNRFRGTLVDDFTISSYQVSLKLSVNRISGSLPSSIVHASSNVSLDVLDSNIFACHDGDLPKQDPSSSSYFCGSYDVEVASYTWLVSIGVTVIILVIIQYVARIHISSIHDVLSKLKTWYHAGSIYCYHGHQLSSDVLPILYLAIPQTKAFLLHIHTMWQIISYLCLAIIAIAIPFYAGIHGIASIVSYDYAYITSMAFLHGIAPVIFISIFLIIIFYLLSTILLSLKDLLYRSIYQQPRPTYTISSPISITSKSRIFLFQSYLIFFSIHLLNFVIVMSINIAYINTLAGNTTYSRSELFIIQIAVGLFKTIWNARYVPWSCDWMASFTTHQRSMQSVYFMSIMNFIIAPVISTIIFSQSCVYYVFNTAPVITSNANFISLTGINCVASNCLSASVFVVNIHSASSSAFDYSYACGTSLIVAYTPVLIASNFFYILFRPLSKIILAFDNPVNRMYKGSTIQRVNGRKVSVRMMIHMTILLTFGVASPVVGFTSALPMMIDCVIAQVLVGKILLETIQAPIPTYPTTNNPIVSPSATISSSSNQAMQLTPVALMMENLDMNTSWEGVFVCYYPMVFLVMLFWSLLFFDMIADVYGSVDAIITSLCYAILPTMLIYASDRLGWMNRIASRYGGREAMERRIAKLFSLKSCYDSASSSNIPQAVSNSMMIAEAGTEMHAVNSISSKSQTSDNMHDVDEYNSKL